MAESAIRIGTSGWNYKSWVGPFYPDKTGQERLLAEYAKAFDSVELNNSFYHLPGRKSVEKWRDTTPRGFLFACKANRFITHMKKLKDPRPGLARFLKSVKPLGGKLGPILFQLPPHWRVDAERLEGFCKALPKGGRYAFELRDKSWLREEIYDVLRRHNSALCFYDLKGFRSPEIVTADFVYVRLHGPREEPYQGSYDWRTLAAYARKFRRWSQGGCDVFCYFDNDQEACAPHDARRLIKSVAGK